MQIRFDLHVEPPPPAVLESARKHQEKLLPITLLVLLACATLAVFIHLKIWDHHPDWQFLLEYLLIALGIGILALLGKMVMAIVVLMRLNEAHPVTTRAYLESSSNEAVKSYCRKVIQQGRNLTLKEADILLASCKARGRHRQAGSLLRRARTAANLGDSLMI